MKMNKTRRKIVICTTIFLALIASLWTFISQWVLRTWANLKIEELLFEIKAPLEGSGSHMVEDALMSCGIPTLLFLVFVVVMICFLSDKNGKRLFIFCSICWGISVIALLGSCSVIWKRLGLTEYFEAMSKNSTYIEDNYVNPNEVKLTFPDEKRNLVYIYLESMEITYADQSAGGAFDRNVIPELTTLAMENEDFSGGSDILNGAHVPFGTSWTMGALFAHTSGLPLKVDVDDNAMNTQDAFFPAMINLGDILENEGYNQSLLIGSIGNFGGRSLYFTEHGNYNIIDYYYALNNGLIPQGYNVWWGFEDLKLFDIAKAELLSLAQKEDPFNLTLLTADTHFEDGYVCEACTTEWGTDQYSNVFSCASRQVNEFIKWMQQQEFYEDTAIVIVGDHLTMDSDYCQNVDEEYERKIYTAFINSAVECQNLEQRQYSTFDLFPTTLATMGVKIHGNRLGLGTNLFSMVPTLSEKYGFEQQDYELQQRSSFIDDLGNIQEDFGKSTIEIVRGENVNSIVVKVYDITGIDESIASVEMEIDNLAGNVRRIGLDREPDRSYMAGVDISSIERGVGRLKVFAIGESGNRYQIASTKGNLFLSECTDLDLYLDELVHLSSEYNVFIAVAEEASNSLTPVTVSKLRSLGITKDISYGSSFCAVISPEGVKEDVGDTVLTIEGELLDGEEYRVISGGHLSGNYWCRIYIDKNDYAVNTRGLNFVVYDNVLGQVVDTKAFDTWFGPIDAVVEVRESDDNMIEMMLSDIHCTKVPEKIIVRYWDGQNPDILKEAILDKKESGIYEVLLSLEEISFDNLYMAVYILDTSGDEIRLTGWH